MRSPYPVRKFRTEEAAQARAAMDSGLMVYGPSGDARGFYWEVGFAAREVHEKPEMLREDGVLS